MCPVTDPADYQLNHRRNQQPAETATVINSIEWRSPQDRKNIFEDVQKKVFPRLKVK